MCWFDLIKYRMAYSWHVRWARLLLAGRTPSAAKVVFLVVINPALLAEKRPTMLSWRALLPFIRELFKKGWTRAPTLGSGQVSCSFCSIDASTFWHHLWTSLNRKRFMGEFGSWLEGSHLIRNMVQIISGMPTSAASDGNFLLNLDGEWKERLEPYVQSVWSHWLYILWVSPTTVYVLNISCLFH